MKQRLQKTLSGPAPYLGPWTRQSAAHLLRRASFGPTRAEIEQAYAAGLDATLDLLLADPGPTPPPLNHYFPDDPNVPIGATWIDAPLLNGLNFNYRNQSLQAWIRLSIMDAPVSLQNKMWVFWHNHFGMANVPDTRLNYQFLSLFRQFATGNFRDLIKAITVHPAMLFFLDGRISTAESPNENYARELLELFTVGKGPQVAPGDYTHYTELDVTECARILTGWRTQNINSTTAGLSPASYFDPSRHDTGTKTLSHRFDNATITDGGEQEYETLIDLIFLREEVARHVCRKLYRYFVYYEIDAAVEIDVIEPLAQVFIDADYELGPVLRSLFGSAHFYDPETPGDLLKTPMEFSMSIVRPVAWSENFGLELRYEAARKVRGQEIAMGMEFLKPPSVAGWEAWYQSPTYHRLWLNGSTLQQRIRFANDLAGNGLFVQGFRREVDWVTYIADFPNPFDPNALVATVAETFLPQPLLPEQLNGLKEILIPGLPDFEWTDEYGLHLANPDDTMLRTSLLNKLRNLMRAVFNMAEFQLA